MEFFRYTLDQIGETGDLTVYHSDIYKSIFYEILPEAMEKLLSDQSPEALAEAATVYNMFTEGVLAETGYFGFYQTLEANKMMPGLLKGVGLLKKDESRHIAYGTFLLQRIISEHPHIFKQVEKRMEELSPLAIALTPEQREARVAIRTVINNLISSIQRNAGAPEMASLFTDRVSEKWGGRERYQRLLWLHTMLRPISGHGSSGDYPKLQEDGSALMRISIHHAAPPTGRGNASVGFALVSSSSGDQPEPVVDLAAIRAGEQHYITFHLVLDGDAWRIHGSPGDPDRTTRHYRRGRTPALPTGLTG